MNKLDRTIEKAASNERIDFTEALILLNEAELLTLADLANKKRQTLNSEPIVTFVVDRNINYTNICISGCLFCAFYCPPGHADAYVISKKKTKRKNRRNSISRRNSDSSSGRTQSFTLA